MNLHQLTDPAEICEQAVWHLGDSRSIEGTLGLAAFGSPIPSRDVSRCEPGVWVAFCRAAAIVAHMGEHWGMIGQTNTEREAWLRRSAVWIREHSGVVIADDEVEVYEYCPGRYQGRIKDQKLGYLGPFIKDTPEEALADAHRLIQKVRDREAYKAGDENFEEVTTRVCGVTYSEVRRKLSDGFCDVGLGAGGVEA